MRVETSIATWLVNDGTELCGARAEGDDWVWSTGGAIFCDSGAGPVAFDPAAGDESEARDLWIRSVLPLLLQARGTQVLHASALAGPRGVVAICGRSTAGKSTLAAAAQSPDLRVVADDSLAFAAGDDKALALTLPYLVRLRPAAYARLGALAQSAGPGGEELPLAGIIMIDRDAQAAPAEWSPVSPTEALGALMPHAYCFSLSQSKEQLVEAYAELVERVPVVGLSFRRDLNELPAVVEEVRAFCRAN